MVLSVVALHVLLLLVKALRNATNKPLRNNRISDW